MLDNSSVNNCKQTSVNKCKQQLEIDVTDLDRITSPLAIRIPASYKALYMKLSPAQKQVFKTGILSLLESIAKGVPSTVQNGPIVVNMNINMNNNMASTQVENNVTFNLNLKETLEELFKWLDRIASPVSGYGKNIPLYVKSDAARYRAKIAKLLSQEVN